MKRTDIKNLLLPDPLMAELESPVKSGDEIITYWNAVPLFFNVPDPAQQPANYRHTSDQDAMDYLFIDIPGNETLEYFLKNYWYQISYGKFSFGIDYPRGDDGKIFIADIDLSKDDGTLVEITDWAQIIKIYLKDHADKVWKAGKEKWTPDGKKWIPSVFLVNRNTWRAFAHFRSYEIESNGETYVVGDVHVIKYNFNIFKADGTTLTDEATSKKYWQTIAHEFSHNFAEQGDLYGPSGAVGYWDHLGDGCTYGMMSEICSLYKFAAEWLEFKHVIKGPSFTKQSIELLPYTTSGDAVLVMPDPYNTPHEFFLLEYRKSTGTESWRPDGAIPEEGLLIFHVNTMFPMNHTPWNRREAPPLDVEMANFRDKGTTLRIYFEKIAGNLYPQPDNNEFSSFSQPNSNFYGQRSSGLHLSNISVSNGKLKFDIKINGYSQPGWFFMDGSHYITGRFSPESHSQGAEIVGWNASRFTLLHEREGQFVSLYNSLNDVAGFYLYNMKNMVAGDFDGDGQDEIYIRTAEYNTIIKYRYGRFERIQRYLALWDPKDVDKEYATSLLPQSKQQILLHSYHDLVLWRYTAGEMEGLAQYNGTIGSMPIDNRLQVIPAYISSVDYQDLILFNGEKLTLLHLDESSMEFEEMACLNNLVGSWNFNAGDKLVPVDLDGDDLEEIFMRSADSMGFMKWENNALTLKYYKENWIEHSNGNANSKIELSANDILRRGRFREDKEGIYHISGKWIYQLMWDDTQSEVLAYKHLKGGQSVGYDNSDEDQYIVADFHRLGEDINLSELGNLTDFNTDNLSDIFVVNSKRALLVSPNFLDNNGDILDQLDVIWRLDKQIPMLNPGSYYRSVVSVSEDLHGRNQLFLDMQSGAHFSRELFVNMIEEGLYPDYHIRVINGVKTPVSDPNIYKRDNLDR